MTEHHLEFLSLKEAAQAPMNLHLSKCHIVGNHMSRLKCAIFTNYKSHMTARDISRRYVSVQIQIRWLLVKQVDHDLHCFATMINSNKLFFANSHFRLVLITIANCLGPDQDPGQADTLSDLF